MGDQLYADVWAPLPQRFPRASRNKYERYWGDDAYRELLAACPTLVSCDDHEFWNDFPQPQVQVPLTWDRFQPRPATRSRRSTTPTRARSTRTAGAGRTLNVGPVSFFIADTRSHRTRDDDPHARLMTEEQWEDLEAWASKLHGPGVLVLPQPLLKAGGARPTARCVDFKESDRLGAIFEQALGGDPNPHDILILTGDIHTGRLSSAEIVGLPRPDPRARRQPRQPRHAVPAAVGPQARRRRRTS